MPKTFTFNGHHYGSGTQQNGEFHRVDITNPPVDPSDERRIAAVTCKLSHAQKAGLAIMAQAHGMDRSELVRGLVEVALEFQGDAKDLGANPVEFIEDAARFYLDYRKSGKITEESVRRIVGRAAARILTSET
jgi:hypothetical protein